MLCLAYLANPNFVSLLAHSTQRNIQKHHKSESAHSTYGSKVAI